MEKEQIQKQQHKQQQNELLLDTLSRLWHHYLHSPAEQTAGDHASVKQHWLKLFLYNCQYIDGEILQNDVFKSFFNKIPEELCSYLLEQVYQIISAAQGSSPPINKHEEVYTGDVSITNDSEATIKQLRRQHNFAQLILNTPSDCNKIIALRTFLTHELGQHLLQFLLRVNINLIASQKSLVQLCINLFPNCNWSTHIIPLQRQTSITDFINNFKLQNGKNKKPVIPQQLAINPHNANISKFEDFINATKTSDEIALLLIQLLTKCVHTEPTETTLSVSIHNFALGYLCATNEAQPTVPSTIAIANEDIIKFELLQLIALCVNNFSNNSENRHVLDFNSNFSHLLYALVANRTNKQLAYAILYIMFGMLQQLIDLRNHQRGGSQAFQFHKLAMLDVQTFDACFTLLYELLGGTEIDASINLLFTQIYKTLLRLTDNLARYEHQVLSTTGAHATKPVHRRKQLYTQQLHCTALQQRSFCCYFQGKLFDLLPLLSVELQEHSMRYWLRTGSCCCHYNLANYATFLRLATQVSSSYQKCAYKFLHYHMLNTLYAPRTGNATTTTASMTTTTASCKRLQSSCIDCAEKIKSQSFHAALLALYKASYKTLASDDSLALLHFLKHLKHIAYQLTYDLSSGIVAEIVLPIFRTNKLVVQPIADMPNSAKVPKLQLRPTPCEALRALHECLCIFVMYLNDIRLIKAFYNEENIRHMEELLSIPELQRDVCDLIKVGIDNITFLGDNSHEQAVLSRRLITLQLNSSDRAAQLFHELLARTTSSKFWLDDNTLRNDQHLLAAAGPKPADILYIAALQWSLNYELLKTSQMFYNEFAKIYSIVVEPDDETDVGDVDGNGGCGDAQSEHSNKSSSAARSTRLKHGDKNIIDILKLNYNALSCFLLTNKANQIKTTKPAATPAPPLPSPPPPLIAPNDVAVVNDDNANICCSSSVEAFVSSLQVESLSTGASMISSLATSTWSTSTYGTLDYTSLISDYKSSPPPPPSTSATTLQQRLQLSQFDESIVLFDIRNQSLPIDDTVYSTDYPSSILTTAITKSSSSNSSGNHFLLDPVTHATSSVLLAAATEAATQLHQHNDYQNVEQHNASLIGKLFSMVGSLFGAVNRDSSTESLALQIDVDLLCLYEANGDCKRLLLKLFEATMAICIKGYQNEEVDKMQKHLRKLKALILSHAQENWTEYAEQNARDNTIIQTLQTLLKIAELSNMLNEPAGIVSSSSFLTNNTDATTEADTTLTALSSPSALQRTRARSFNSCGGSGVELPKLQRNVGTQLPAKNMLTTPPTPRRPVSGESGDADYFSTRASLLCADSEVEFSENDNDYYLTADEGYEADGEIPEITESECELTAVGTNTNGGGGCIDLWHALQPTSRYRTHVMHDGLCRLVIEILIELATKCTRNPRGWADNLAQLANRLFVIRDYLGGAFFLLRGFAPVLSCNDPNLRELQQSILELVTHINTPEVLTTYCSILATKNPPVEMLIKYMQHITVNTLKKAQPYVELEYPVNLCEDGNCIVTSEHEFYEQIERIRTYHVHCQANTPFTRAPCIIPVRDTRLWTDDGLTVSLWLEVRGQQTRSSSIQLSDDETRYSCDDLTRTHIVSFGTNQAMLSIYVNNNMQLVFELCRPNAELPMRSPTEADHIDEVDTAKSTTKSNRNHINGKQNEAAPPTATNYARHALKQTKMAFLNSFSQMHFLNGHHGHDTDVYFEVANVELKYLRLLKNKWTHLVFAVDNHPDRLDVTIFMDGLEHHTITLPFRSFRAITRTFSFQMMALGDGVPARSPYNTTNCTGSRSTLDSCTPRLNIATLMLFKRKIMFHECIWHLTAMGPDFTEFSQCQVGNWKPNYGYLNLTKMSHANFGNFNESMKFLRQMRALTYTAQQPDTVMCYDTTKETTVYSTAGLILYGEVIQNQLQSIQTASVLCGGLAPLLYLFARVVELTSNAYTQSLALDLLLSVAHSETQLFTEFQSNDYISLIGYVIKTERCSKDVQLLRSIMNNACTQPLVIKKGDALHVNENSIATLIYPRLLISVLHRYSDWHRSGAEHSDVLEMLLRGILALTREKHPHRDFNMEQLQKAGLLQELLNLYKVYVIESPNPVYISKDAAESYVQIIAVFAGSPPSPSLLDEIMKLLMLLQKPSECYITHDRGKFYFLLTSQLPAKERSLVAANLSRVTTPFRRNLLNSHPGGAVPLVDETEQKRLARIKRLRQIHAGKSSYRRALHEFEENLENVADCSKLNKSALRLLSPVEAERWHLKYKRLGKYVFKPSPAKKDKRDADAAVIFSPQKVTRRRIRPQPLRYMPTDKNLPPKYSMHSLITGSLFTFDSDSSGTENAFSSTPMSKHTRPLLKTDFYGSVGIIALQEGLLTLLKDFLCLLPDIAVDEVLKHYVKIEFLLVLANHNSGAVRAAIIRLLAALTKRLPASELAASHKQLYSLHLANQLAIYPSDTQMFEACVSWLTGVYGNLTIILNCDTALRIRQRFGMNAMLAIASKTSITQPDYAERAFAVLRRIFLNNPDEHPALIEAGLLQCCVKALYNLYAPPVHIINAKTEWAIVELLATIGEKSLKSVGQINIVWDILNMLAFYQEKQSASIVRSFRSVQALLKINWLTMYFEQTNVPWHFKVITPSECSLTPSECRTRLDMLVDRCSQFFTTHEANYSPSEHEIKLFELLVSYGISTNQRCNNFIAWGLQPSRPRDLRAYIVDALWISCQDDFQPAIICDGKMIKALLWLSLLEDLEQPIENLPRLCNSLGITESDSTWNLENELERIETHRCNVLAKQKAFLEKTIFKFETLAQHCIESSMQTTRRVAELQNAERKLLMSHMKDYDDTYTNTKWLEIIRRMTHEGAPWYCKARSESSWELDDTEGPSRVHTRLRRCHLEIDKRFFMQAYRNNSADDDQHTSTRNADYVRPLDYLVSSYDQQLNISLNSQILYNFPAKYLPVDGEIDGEIIITDHKLYFLATYRCKYFNVNCDIANITEIWLKRHQHQEKAFEIFLDTNKSLFFSLQNQEDWKIMRDVFCDKIVTTPDNGKIQLITQQWREGLLTNWEYLMTLNQIAGRTYNDLMQYPVFPWILSNYKSDILDLTEGTNFRKLEKPIAVQSEANEQHYIDNYNYINNTITNMGSIILKPYHYSSHYSNSGTVLHFLVRVPPFTSYFLRYQDNNFDLPDRTFHALGTTWCLASRDSPTDVKEIIPEFFCLPEMFENFERFNFGCRQNGERVEDVLLPNWCQRDPRLFVLIHRQALESELVRRNLHNWIDLIFGEKQFGEKAIEAINVFHPATYAVFLESEIIDPIERKAVETMVKTYGQMPRQLFKAPHSPSKALNYSLVEKQILPCVRGLRWGVYAGSPQLPPPTLGNIAKLPHAEQLVSFNNTNVVYGLHAKSCVMQGAEPDTYNVISWSHADRIVRILPLNKPHAKPKQLLYNNAFDDISACGCDINSNQLWFGHKSGRISVYKCVSREASQRITKGRQNYVRNLRLSYNSAFRKMTTKGGSGAGGRTDADCNGDLLSNHSPIHTNSIGGLNGVGGGSGVDVAQRDGVDLCWSGPTLLVRHTDEITYIALSVEFKIAVSAGRDGIAVIWDLNDWSYVRTIERPAEIHHSPITHVAISPTLGDIVTVHTLPQHCDERGGNENAMQLNNAYGGVQSPDECFEVTEESLDDFVNVNINPNGKSILRLHSVNARYVQHIVHEDRILAVCYSYIKEGVGVNVIATAMEGGFVRLWSSWNLSFVSEIITGTTNIKSITYSTHQHLVVLTRESHIQVWETEGLYGNSPKFPQIAYK